MQHINDDEISASITAVEAQQALLDAFTGLAAGKAALQKRYRTEAEGVKLSTLGAVIPHLGVTGAKVYTTIAGKFQFVILLFSTENGMPLATFDANAITKIRTAATTVLAARKCARQNSKTLAIFGYGQQGREHAQQLAEAFPIEKILIVDPFLPAESLEPALGNGARVVSVAGHDALKGADIVVTASRSQIPLFDGNLIEEGTFIAAIGSSLPHTRELDDTALTRASTVIVDWQAQALDESGDLLLASAGCGLYAKVVDLADILASPKSLSSERNINVYKSVGIGLQDIAIAGLAYKKIVSDRK